MSRAASAPEWYSISALLEGRPGPHWAMALATWIRDTVAVPLPGLGRAGALCPFVPRALTLGSLFACDGTTDRPSEIRGAVETARRNFATCFPLQGEADNLKALLVAFPKLKRADWPALRAARGTVKPDFIANGFTLSEFHDDSDDRSVRNPQIRIARSPVPCIIIRRLQLHDEIFLRSQPELHPIFLARRKDLRANG